MAKPRLTTRESVTLWGGLTAVAFGFFMLGLWLGYQERTGVDEAADSKGTSSRESAPPQTRTRLDLANPVESSAGSSVVGSTEKAVPKTSETGAAKPSSAATRVPPRVELQPPPRETSATKPPAAAATKGTTSGTPTSGVAPGGALKGAFFTIQLGALKTEAEARKLVTRLQAKGYTGIVQKPVGADRFYRVRVGNYPTREAARTAEVLLQDAGFMTFIKKMDGRSTD